MIKACGAICSLFFIGPLTGCHHAFTQSSGQIRKWKLDDGVHVVARSEHSKCQVSDDPSLNYNRLTVEILDENGKQLSGACLYVSAKRDEPPLNISGYVARADASRQIIWVTPQNNLAGSTILVARSPGQGSNSGTERSYGPDTGIPLEDIPAQ